jgi:hypothetical protein
MLGNVRTLLLLYPILDYAMMAVNILAGQSLAPYLTVRSARYSPHTNGRNYGTPRSVRIVYMHGVAIESNARRINNPNSSWQIRKRECIVLRH